MKNLIWISAILFVFILGTDTTNAQVNRNTSSYNDTKTVVSIRPVSLLFTQPNVKIEHAVNPSISVGAGASYFTGLNPGLKAEPFVRLYTGKRSSAPEGFYLQTKMIVGNHKAELNELTSTVTGGEGEDRFTAMGGGFGVGRQWLVGKTNNIAIDLYSGFKRYKPLGNDVNGDRFVFSATRNFPMELRFNVGIAF